MGNNRESAWLIVGALLVSAVAFACVGLGGVVESREENDRPAAQQQQRGEAVEVIATLTLEALKTVDPGNSGAEVALAAESASLAELYRQVNPGVVSIRAYVERGGTAGRGVGSGFLLDGEGHIVTNQHVVADAELVTAIFHNGFEVRAEVVGQDEDSDLAVIRVDEVPEGASPLGLAGTETVQPGDRVIAIGNPFSLGGSMSLGIVSAVERSIRSRTTPFRIPEVIQTDAAINPGNSGGPLLNLDGRLVGVNAQIASGGTGVNTGVGFAIPSDVVRRVVPSLIEQGAYAWPWLGVRGLPVNLLVQEANDLSIQRGAYIVTVSENSPAAEAGLRGATRAETVLGAEVPAGGDVVLEADGRAIEDFAALLAHVAFQQPGDTIELTVLRDGGRVQVTVELVARPENIEP